VRVSKFVCAATTAAACCVIFSPAFAQERTASWSGAYAGLSFGAASSRSRIGYTAAPAATGGFSALGAASIVQAGNGSISSSGVMAGAQTGYNWQWGQLVAGGELDIAYTDLGGTRVVPLFGVPDSLHEGFASHFFSTVRGRVGFARDRWLAYATGGLALAGLSVSDIAASTAGTAQSSSHQLRAGWTLGGGVEWRIMPRWSVKAEYLYADLGTLTDQNTFPLKPLAITTHDHRLTENIARLGINYHFQ
jgi:outer membrane immunogenic protein